MNRKDKDTMTVFLVSLVAVGSFVWGYFLGAKDAREIDAQKEFEREHESEK